MNQYDTICYNPSRSCKSKGYPHPKAPPLLLQGLLNLIFVQGFLRGCHDFSMEKSSFPGHFHGETMIQNYFSSKIPRVPPSIFPVDYMFLSQNHSCTNCGGIMWNLGSWSLMSAPRSWAKNTWGSAVEQPPIQRPVYSLTVMIPVWCSQVGDLFHVQLWFLGDTCGQPIQIRIWHLAGRYTFNIPSVHLQYNPFA